MQEIIEIAKRIIAHHSEEKKENIRNKAVASISAICDDKLKVYWLIVKAEKPGFTEYIDGRKMQGEITLDTKALHEDGIAIPRDGIFGSILIKNIGNFEHKGPKKVFTYNILNRAIYDPFADEIKDILIKLNGDDTNYRYPNVNELLKLQLKKEEAQSKLDQAKTDQEMQIFRDDLKKIEEEQNNLISKVKNFIRNGFNMRYQPILDPIQDSIRRENIFDGKTLIINGGPGTGKTISLVQRIKFLISPTIEKSEDEGYYELSKRQKEILFNSGRNNWIFFSPSELLSLFLKDTMVKEGLEANSKTVTVWESYKRTLINLYTINKKGENDVFLFPNKNDDTWALNSLFKNEPQNIKNLIKEFEEYYIRKQKEKLEENLNTKVDNFPWAELGKKIQESLKKSENVNNIDSLLTLFVSLRSKYKNEIDNLMEELKNKTENLSAKLQTKLQKDEQRYVKISELITKTNDEDEDDDEESYEQNTKNYQIELAKKLRKICKREGLRKIISIARIESVLLQLIPEINDSEYSDELVVIGELVYFERLFKKILVGNAENALLNEIPKMYKEFRLNCYAHNNGNYYHLNILEQVIDKKDNKKIHKDEQAFLLYFINNFCYNLAKKREVLFENATHKYIKGYKNNCKSIIGIDEATDFSIIDILAMHSLKNNDIYSVTLSGDILQSVTNNGLKSWNDIPSGIIDTNKKDLNISYRQSYTLVNLANDMNSYITKEAANYKSYLQKSEEEPKLLVYISKDEEAKLKWISHRIKEIYKKYQEAIQQLPSIAILTCTEEEGEVVATLLEDLLIECGINVRYCRGGEVLGDSNSVRVFCLEKIKGLEFEACFIHNFDKLQNQNSETAVKYIYVGLSRAAFYLGLTSSAEFSDDLKFMNCHFDKDGDWS
jgi:hypothetical protein